MKRRKALKAQQANNNDTSLTPVRAKTRKFSNETVKSEVNNGTGCQDTNSGEYNESAQLQALAKDPSLFVNKFNLCCEDIKQSMQEIMVLKTSSTQTSAKQIARKRTETLMSILSLKDINRTAQVLCKSAKDETQEAKAKCESIQLQLENLLYEIVHLKKEITKCFQFKSCDEDIQLLDMEEFYRIAPESVTMSDKTRNDSHLLRLAQLQWELQEREKLADKCKLAKEQKEVVTKRIEEKRKKLKNLAPILDSILTASRPLQDYLSLSISQVDSSSSARFLPRPLYFLFVQANAYQEAHESDIGVAVTGDLSKAKHFDQNSVDEAIRISSRSKSETKDDLEAKRNALLSPHPLNIHLRIKTEGDAVGFSVYYYPAFNLCTVKDVKTDVSLKMPDTSSAGQMLDSLHMLSCLFPSDRGTDTPNATNHQQLKTLRMKSFANLTKKIGNPYIWVQSITGLNFFPKEKEDLPTEPASADLLPTVIDAITTRLKSRTCLLKQVISLESLQLLPTNADGKLFPVKTYSQIKEFKAGSDVDIESCRKTGVARNKLLSNSDSILLSIKYSYRRAKLNALIVLEPDYPVHPPLINIILTVDQKNLTSDNDADVKSIETEVNVFYDELLKYDSADFLLTNILKRLQVCFEIYVEARLKDMSDKSVADLPHRMILQSVRGRDRVKPYKYLENPGCFTTRAHIVLP